MNQADLKSATADWVASLGGLTDDRVLTGRGTPDPKGVRRGKPYAQLTLITTTQLGQEQSWAGESPGNEHAVNRHVGHRIAEFDLQFYGLGGGDVIEDLRRACWRQRGIDEATDLGIQILDVGPTIHLAQLLDSAYEERAQVDLMVGYVVEEFDTEAGTIEDAAVTNAAVGGMVGTVPLIVDTTNP